MATGTGGAPRRFAAFALGVLVAASALLTGPAPASAEGSDCTLPDVVCPSSTTVEDPPADVSSTTTEAAPTTTTVRAPVTTVPRATTTSARATTTTTTVETITTVTNLLVPGDGTDGAESTTTTLTSTAATVTDDGPSDGTLIALVIAGLLVIAVVVSLLTWRYWVATRPPLLEDPARATGDRRAQAPFTPPLRSG